MNLERLIALIVRTIVEELDRQGLLRIDGAAAPDAPAPPASKSVMVGRRIVTAQTVLDAVSAGHTRLDISVDAIVTPLAADVAREKKIAIQRVTER